MCVGQKNTALLWFTSETVLNVAGTYFREDKMLYLSVCTKVPTHAMSVFGE